MTTPTIFKVGSVVPLFDERMQRLQFCPVLLTLKDLAVVVKLAVAVVSIGCCCVMTFC